MARKYSKSASKDVEREMHKYKRGKLKSGSGRKVKSRKQAIAIGLSEARKKGKKVPKRKKGKRKSKGRKKRSAAPLTRDRPERLSLRLERELIRQVRPFRTHLFDQRDLPRAVPSFDRALTLSRFEDRGVLFEVEEPVQCIFGREAAGVSVFVLAYSADKVAGGADVENALRPIG
jgi:hypothetical protein